MIEFNRIFTGGMELCPPIVPGLAFVHACKTCHRQLCGQPRPTDPDYLYREHNGELFLNIIDPDKPLFSLPLFEHALNWMTLHHRNGKDVIIHCDQGNSRSRSLALLLCARLGFITADSLSLAAFEFADKTGHAFTPGRGIMIFMEQNWEALTGEIREPKGTESMTIKKNPNALPGWSIVENGWWANEALTMAVCREKDGWHSYIKDGDTPSNTPSFPTRCEAMKDAEERSNRKGQRA